MRSYSRGESLKRATWNGPSLSVTFTGARVIISPAPLHPHISKAALVLHPLHAIAHLQSAHRGKMRACAIISRTLVLPELWSPTTTTCAKQDTRTGTYEYVRVCTRDAIPSALASSHVRERRVAHRRHGARHTRGK